MPNTNELRSSTESERNARAIEKRFRHFVTCYNYGPAERVDVFFEHGQYWARVTWKDPSANEGDDMTFSVVDLGRAGGGFVDFGFEEV